MALTAADIEKVNFSIDRKGYNVDEVDVFLERVENEVDSMNRQIADLHASLDDAQNQIAQQQAQLGQQAQALAQSKEQDRANASAPSDGATRYMPMVSGEAPAYEEAAPVATTPVAQLPADESAQVAQLQARIADLERRLEEKKANDTAISQALIVAQRSADDIVAKAKKEASDIVKDAEEESDRIIGKAEGERRKINDSINQLQTEREQVRGEYRDMLADFVADAQRRINAIGDDAHRSHAVQPYAAPQTTNAMPAASQAAPAAASSEASSYAVPVSNDAAAQQPVPTSQYVEKDLSGFGDADNDFDFTDPD